MPLTPIIQNQGLYNGGYGYEIKEIINFYDYTDKFKDAPIFEVIIDDMLEADKKLDFDNKYWLDENDVADFESFFLKWHDQSTYFQEDYTTEEIIVSGCDSSWNQELVTRYNDKISAQYLVNAVVPHLYLSAKNAIEFEDISNWGRIPNGAYNDGGSYIPTCLHNHLLLPAHQDFDEEYTFGIADSRLSCAFQGIINRARTGSFSEFIATKQKEAMIAF